jgi:phosphohistidine phosphatase
VAVVGHNPSLGELVSVLGDGQGDAALQRDLEAGFPTGGVAVFELAGPFADLEPGSATLRDFTVPGR